MLNKESKINAQINKPKVYKISKWLENIAFDKISYAEGTKINEVAIQFSSFKILPQSDTQFLYRQKYHSRGTQNAETKQIEKLVML